MLIAVKSRFDPLNRARDETVDGVDRLHCELGRRRIINQNLEPQSQQGPTTAFNRNVLTVVRASRIRKTIWNDRESRWQECHRGGISSVHNHLHRTYVNCCVHYKRARCICLRLLQYQHGILVRISSLQRRANTKLVKIARKPVRYCFLFNVSYFHLPGIITK